MLRLVRHTLMSDPHPRALVLHALWTKDVDWLEHFVATVAVLNSFGRPQGLPLIPETVSQRLDFPDLTCHTETYHDVLSAYRDKCIAAVPSHEHWILFDSGAAAHCCPAD